MAYKPKTSSGASSTNNTPREWKPMPIPSESRSLPARISLIVSTGLQRQVGFKDKDTGEFKKPKRDYVEEIVVYADLVDEIVDYGKDIGKKQYRIMCNSEWNKEIKGSKFEWSYVYDKDGNQIKSDKPPTFHQNNLLNQLATASKTYILGVNEDGSINEADNLDIEKLLGQALMVEVEIKSNVDKNGKLDSDGNPRVYHNVRAKKFGKVPPKYPVGELQEKPLLITFDNVTPETAKVLRWDVIQMILEAKDLPGTAMEKVLADMGYKASTPSQEEPTKGEEYEAVSDASEEVVEGEMEDTHAGEVEDFSDDTPW